MRRVVPAIVLFVLSPLVAEYLLGDFTLAALGGGGPIVTPVSHVVLALAAVAVLVAEIGIRARNRQTERHGR